MNLAALCHRCGTTIPENEDRHPLCTPCRSDPKLAAARLSRRCYRNRLRAYRRGLPGFIRPSDVRRLHREQRGRCACCGERLGPVLASPPGFHIDHKRALANDGANDPSNIQLLCPTCNTKKGAR